MRSLACFFLMPLAGLSASAAHTVGTFRLEPAATLYIVSDGNPCRVTVRYAPGPRKGDDVLLTRAFDANEKLAFWRNQMVRLDELPVEHTFGLPGQSGVHQVRLLAGHHKTQAKVTLDRALPAGVCGQRGTLYTWDPSVKEAWVYVPAKASVLDLRGGPLRVIDAAGSTVADLPKAKSRATVPIKRRRVLLKVQFPDPKKWSCLMRGFPFILCPSPEVARAIKASIIELPDGTVVHHRFQAEIAKLLPELLAPENIGRAESLVTPLKSREKEWLEDPIRNSKLLGSYGFMEHVNWSLRTQDVDPASPTSGAITLKKGRRWDNYGAGGSLTGGSLAAGLAQAATLDAGFNPWFGKTELLYRAAACVMRDLMLLDEDETFKSGASGDMNFYPTGCLHFPLAHSHTGAFAIAAPLLGERVRRVWAEGLQRGVDRCFVPHMVSCRNQSSHGLIILWQYYEGTQDERYRDMAFQFSKRFRSAISKDCYDMECIGPDATYQGMTDWHKGLFLRLTRDPVMMESVRLTYRFFNHTVAPESDGRMLGASNFSHRTCGSFASEQWGGAKGICDDMLPEVGIWAKPPTAEARAKAADMIRKRLAQPFRDEDYENPNGRARGKKGSQITTPRYLYYTDKPLTGTWPAQEDAPFVRSFADELIAVKTPSYYTVAYVGKPAGSFYIRGREKFRKPLPGDIENKGGLKDAKPATPYGGGGLSVFWTPDYGNAVLGMNWSPLTHQGIVVRKADKTRWWEDYHKTEFKLDEEAKTLSITGAVEGCPLTYSRRYGFGDEALSVELEITATGPFACASMIENIPLVFGSVKPRGVTAAVPSRGKSFRVVDGKGAGVEWVFEREQAFKNYEKGLKGQKWTDHVCGRVEVALPTKLAIGQSVTLRYDVRPVK